MAHVHHDVVGHTSADDEYLETPPGAGHEHTDASAWVVAKFFIWLGIAAAIIHIGLALLFNVFVEERVERTAPRYPLAVGEGPRLPPEPRLQRFPRADILTFRSGEEQLLQRYGWTDKNAGAVHIPIQDAMRLMLERKVLTSRPQTTDPSEAADMMPADSSAGRTMERRRE